MSQSGITGYSGEPKVEQGKDGKALPGQLKAKLKSDIKDLELKKKKFKKKLEEIALQSESQE